MSINEEQIAIETLKEVASDDFDTLGDDISPKMAQNILNVISNQQKEIEDLKEDLDKKVKALDIAMSNPDYICKDKIRDYKKDIEWERQQEIENIGMSMLGSAIDVLNKLLEEK